LIYDGRKIDQLLLSADYFEHDDNLKIDVVFKPELIHMFRSRFGDLSANVVLIKALESIETMENRPLKGPIDDQNKLSFRKVKIVAMQYRFSGQVSMFSNHITVSLTPLYFSSMILDQHYYSYSEMDDREARVHQEGFQFISCIRDKRKNCKGTIGNDWLFLMDNVSIASGLNGRNVLDLTFVTSNTLNINRTSMPFQKILVMQTGDTTTLEHFQGIMGRYDRSETVQVDCYVDEVNLRGGCCENSIDEMIIEDSDATCDKMTVFVNGYTAVKNYISKGNFSYNIPGTFSNKANISIYNVPNSQCYHTINFGQVASAVSLIDTY